MWLGSRDKLYLVGGDRGVRARVGCECVNGGIRKCEWSVRRIYGIVGEVI